MASLGEFIKETRAELKHVSWPTRKQAAAYTAIVILISLFVALLLGFSDYAFSAGLKYVISHF